MEIKTRWSRLERGPSIEIWLCWKAKERKLSHQTIQLSFRVVIISDGDFMGHARFPLCTIWTSTLHCVQFCQLLSSNNSQLCTLLVPSKAVCIFSSPSLRVYVLWLEAVYVVNKTKKISYQKPNIQHVWCLWEKSSKNFVLSRWNLKSSIMVGLDFNKNISKIWHWFSHLIWGF